MKPTTEQILSALNEMIQSKTELKSEKVDLSIKDDMQKQITKIQAVRKKIEGATKEFKKAKDDALNVREEGVDIFQRAGAIREDAIDAAKELGVDPRGINGFDTLDKTMDNLNKEYQDLLKMI